MMSQHKDNSVIINKAIELGASLSCITPVKALKASSSYKIYDRSTGEKKAEFVTAFLAGSESTISRIRSSPKWKIRRE